MIQIDDKLQNAARDYANNVASSLYSMEDFIAGAQWQRNHVWHDISEKPTEAKSTLMIDNKYWCYLEDIIPTNR